jgi:hypothetical protein
MPTIVIVKNNTVATQWLSDFGIALAASGQVTLTDTATRDHIYGSVDLKTKVANSIFVINDGTNDLSLSDAIDYLDFTTDYELNSVALSGIDLEPIYTDIDSLSGAIDLNTGDIVSLSGAIDINIEDIVDLKNGDYDRITRQEMAMIIAFGF